MSAASKNPNLSVMKSCPDYESTALRGCRGFRNTTVFRCWNLTTQNAFGSGNAIVSRESNHGSRLNAPKPRLGENLPLGWRSWRDVKPRAGAVCISYLWRGLNIEWRPDGVHVGRRWYELAAGTLELPSRNYPAHPAACKVDPAWLQMVNQAGDLAT